MNLQETIKLLIQEQGKDAVSSPGFLGMLDDYGAFRDEEPATKTIVRELVRTGQMQRLVNSPNKDRNLHFEIRTIVSETARSGGFREDLVSVTLRKIALGVGKIHKEKDWPTLNEIKIGEEKIAENRKTEMPSQSVPTTEELSPEEWNAVLKSMNAVSRKSKTADPFALSADAKKKPSKSPAKVAPQRVPTPATPIKVKSRPSIWQKIKQGIYYYCDIWCLILVAICLFGAFMTLFLAVFAFFAGAPEAGYWAKWLLACVVTGVLVFMAYCIVDDNMGWFIDKKRR